MNNGEAFCKLVDLCKQNAWPLLRVEYSEAEDCFEVEIVKNEDGIADFYIKRVKCLSDCVKYVLGEGDGE